MHANCKTEKLLLVHFLMESILLSDRFECSLQGVAAALSYGSTIVSEILSCVTS